MGLTARIVYAPAEAIRRVFDEAQRRDPKHRRTWIALVDGANHQIERIKFEARKREVKVTIVIDFVHVLGYLWQAALSRLHPDDDQATAQWVNHQATLVLRRLGPQGRRRDPPPSHHRPPGPLSDTSPPTEAATNLTNKAPYLDYPTALTQGWPIATGIVEGAVPR